MLGREHHFARLVLLVLSASALAAGCAGRGELIASDLSGSQHQAYLQTLEQYSPDMPGLTHDPFGETLQEQPEVYGLYLYAESRRFAATGSSAAASNIRTAVHRLQATVDLDGDGEAGWGLPDAWDAADNGAPNPPNHEYTITNAIVLDGLIEAYESGALNAATSAIVRTLLRDVVLATAANAWVTRNGRRFFAYSYAEADRFYVPNVTAWTAGVFARAASIEGVFALPEKWAVESIADEAMNTLFSSAQWLDGLPFWVYIEGRDHLQDLNHQAYTVIGLQRFAEAGGELPGNLRPETSVLSLQAFIRDGRIYEWPRNMNYVDPYFERLHARSWGVGLSLRCFSWAGRADEADLFYESLVRDYGDYPNLRFYAVEDQIDERNVYFGRIHTHSLAGLAAFVFGARG